MQKDDVIYRQAAIDAICAVCGNDCDKSEFVYNAPQDEQVILCPEHYCLCNLPSAQPERKTGRWICGDTGLMVTEYKCSECGRTVRDDTGYDVYKDYPYCHCGAEMRKDGEE